MSKTKKPVIVYTITKKEFDKLSKKKQRLAVVQDVLDRIKLGQFKPKAKQFVGQLKTSVELEDVEQVSEILKSLDTKCEVCAKGGLFMAYVGIVNCYERKTYTNTIGNGIGQENNSTEMKMLSKVFSIKQLNLIETAFEKFAYDWNVAELSNEEIYSAISFGKIHNTQEKRLKAICNNIIKNEGEFKL